MQLGGDNVHQVAAAFSGGHTVTSEQAHKVVDELNEYLTDAHVSEADRADVQEMVDELRAYIRRAEATRADG